MVVRDSEASRNSVVETASPLASSTGTSAKDRLRDWTIVPPGGYAAVDMMNDDGDEMNGKRKLKICWMGRSR